MVEARHLSRRESQIMDIVYQLGEASVSDVHQRLADPPSYSAVRATMRILEDKGHLHHRRDGQRYLFMPTLPPEEAQESALKRIVRTFFGDSPEEAMAALLDLNEDRLDDEALQRLSEMIDETRRQGR